MKRLAGMTAVICLLLTGAASAAGFRKARHLPRPIDYPYVRPHVREDHKLGKKSGVHRASVTRYEWGRQKNLRYVSRPHPFGHNFYDVF